MMYILQYLLYCLLYIQKNSEEMFVLNDRYYYKIFTFYKFYERIVMEALRIADNHMKPIRLVCNKIQYTDTFKRYYIFLKKNLFIVFTKAWEKHDQTVQ